MNLGLVGKPVLSIITVAYENPEELDSTLQSVKKGWIKGLVEQIVVDGSRSNLCSEVVKGHDWIEHSIHEPDRGKYDAMNKGIRKSQGAYVLFLNSGDSLFDHCDLGRVVKKLGSLEKSYLVYGDAIIALGERLYLREAPSPIKLKKDPQSDLPSHQSIFYPGDYVRATQYADDMHVSADTGLTIKALRRYEAHHLGYPVAVFSLGGVSNVKSCAKAVIAHWKESLVARDKNAIVEAPRLGKEIIKYVFMRLFGWQNYYRITFALRSHIFKPYKVDD